MLEEHNYTEATLEHPTIDEVIQAPIAEVPELEDEDEAPVLTMMVDGDDDEVDEGAHAEDDDFTDSQDGQADAEAAAESTETV